MSVGAIDPVGITKASASKARNRSASVKATTTDSTVSRPHPSGPRTESLGRGPEGGATAGAAFGDGTGFGDCGAAELETVIDISLAMNTNRGGQCW